MENYGKSSVFNQDIYTSFCVKSPFSSLQYVCLFGVKTRCLSSVEMDWARINMIQWICVKITPHSTPGFSHVWIRSKGENIVYSFSLPTVAGRRFIQRDPQISRLSAGLWNSVVDLETHRTFPHLPFLHKICLRDPRIKIYPNKNLLGGSSDDIFLLLSVWWKTNHSLLIPAQLVALHFSFFSRESCKKIHRCLLIKSW